MYPVMIDFKNRLCTVIGGGRAALRKARNLLSDGAVIRVVAPEICAELADMAHEVIYKEYSPECINGSFAVIAAADSAEINSAVLADCRSMGILCMSVKGGGDFEFCAKADCGGAVLSAYTGGEFPMLGAMIRDDMKKRYANCGELAAVLGRYRRAAIERGQRELIGRFAEAVELNMSAEELEKRLEEIQKDSARMVIQRAQESDLREILELQYLAYQSEARLFSNPDIPPLRQTLDDVTAEYRKGIILKATDENGSIIGSVRGYSDGITVYIGKLMVHPERQGQGIGTKLLLAIEKEYPNHRYELFTSTKSKRNIELYERLGYRIFDEKSIKDELRFVYLEKNVM